MRHGRCFLTIGVAMLPLALAACRDDVGPSRQVARVVVTAPAAGTLLPTATLQLYAQILNAAGEAIPGKNAQWSSQQPEIATVSATGLVIAVAAGTATVRAVSDEIVGTFTITVRYAPCSAATAAGTLATGQTRTGDFTRKDCAFEAFLADGWAISVTAASLLRFQLSSPTLASWFVVTDAAMQVLTGDLADAPGAAARASLDLAPGTYFVWALADSAQLGSYTLSAIPLTRCTVASLTGAIAVDQSVAGALTSSSCVLPNDSEAQGWSFSLSAESPVQFDVVASGFTPWIAVTNAAFDLIAAGYPSSATEASLAELLPAGDYQAWVTSMDGGLGAFTLARRVATITPCTTPVGAVAIGQAVSGAIATTDCQIPGGRKADPYTLTVAAGATLQIDLMSNEFDTFLIIHDADGVVVASDDDGGDGVNSRIVQAFPAGTYTIFATTYSFRATGTYTLGVQTFAGVMAGVRAEEGRAEKRPGKRPEWRAMAGKIDRDPH